MNLYFVVHSFTDKVFRGNPAGVCPLEEWLDDELMQKIAAENGLSETAFFVARSLLQKAQNRNIGIVQYASLRRWNSRRGKRF